MSGRLFLLFLLVVFNVHHLWSIGFCAHPGIGYWLMDTTRSVMIDFAEIHHELWALDTIKIATATIPLYLLARLGDSKLHHCFYNVECHKNLNQAPQWFCATVEKLPDIGALIYSSLAVLSPHEDTRRAARIFAVGCISAWMLKDIIKMLDTGASVRPGNERFCKKKTFGGFPSGHMIAATYLATVLGLEYGWKVGLPLSIMAGVVFGMLIGTNRHFASQVVAGAGMGLAYGLAVYKVIEHVESSLWYTLNYDERGRPLMGLAYCF